MNIEEIRNRIILSLISLVKKKRDRFFRIDDSWVFRDENNAFVGEANKSYPDIKIPLSLCVTKTNDGLLVNTILMDVDGKSLIPIDSPDYTYILKLLED